MPTLLMHPEHFFHPTLASLLDELCRSVSPNTTTGRNVYVTRVAPSLFRKLANQAEIEQIARQAGLEIVTPETLSIADQIRIFASADLIVGEFGSAMHNALFSPSGSKVLCLNWINGMQSRIAQLRRHDVGYLLPCEGTAVKYVAGAPRIDYEVDARRFINCLQTLMQ